MSNEIEDVQRQIDIIIASMADLYNANTRTRIIIRDGDPSHPEIVSVWTSKEAETQHKSLALLLNQYTERKIKLQKEEATANRSVFIHIYRD